MGCGSACAQFGAKGARLRCSRFTRVACRSAASSKTDLLALCAASDRGASSSPAQQAEILSKVDELVASNTASKTSATDITASWKLVWTTEKVRGCAAERTRCHTARSVYACCQQQIDQATPINELLGSVWQSAKARPGTAARAELEPSPV